jgi:endonuclease G, mitochondrial
MYVIVKNTLNEINPIIPIQYDTIKLDLYPNVNKKLNLNNLKLIEETIKGIGRIESDDEEITYEGTGWFIAEDVIITNRHIAESIMRIDYSKIDLKTEYGGSLKNSTSEFKILERLYPKSLNDKSDSDIAFFKVETNGKKYNIIKVAQDYKYRKDVMVVSVGYPRSSDMKNGQYRNIALVVNESLNFKNLSVGFIREDAKFNDSVFEHDCSTLEGNSGSAIIDITSGEVIGLHFGEHGEYNGALTCNAIREYAKKIKLKLK